MSVRRFVRSPVLLGAAAIVGIGACDNSTGPQYVAKIIIEPDSVHLEPGETAAFTATPYGPVDQSYPERANWVEWSLDGSEVAELEVTGEGVVTVTATAVGEAGVRAALGRGSDAAPVYIRPPGLASIEIEPAEIVVPHRGAVQARGVLRDASGQELSPEGFRASWKVDDGSVAVTSTPLEPLHPPPVVRLFGLNPGTTRLRLVVGPLATSVNVTVVQ